MNPIMISTYFDILGKAQKIYGRHLEPVCRRWELTRSELDVLLFLHNNPEYDRAADIVAHRGMAKSHVSLSVVNLEQRGLLERKFSAVDRRTAHLLLTAQGQQISAEGKAAQQQFFDQLYQGVTEEEFLLWDQVTQKIRANIEKLNKI